MIQEVIVLCDLVFSPQASLIEGSIAPVVSILPHSGLCHSALVLIAMLLITAVAEIKVTSPADVDDLIQLRNGNDSAISSPIASILALEIAIEPMDIIKT